MIVFIESAANVVTWIIRFFQNNHVWGWGVLIVAFLLIGFFAEWRMSVNAKTK